MIKFYLLFALAIISLTACKSPTKLYQQGNYNDAIEVSLKKLQKDPYDPENRNILKQSYHEAVANEEDRIRILLNSSDENSYDQVYVRYNRLQDLYEKIKRYPVVAQFIKPNDYSNNVQTYKEKASEQHVQKGLKWMEGMEKRSYQQAYREFTAALRYKPTDIDLIRKVEEAFNLASINVLLIPMDAYNNNYYYSNSSYQLRNFQDAIIRSLSYNSGNEFIRFYTEADARTRKIEPDEIVEMRMGRMNIGQPYDQNSNKQVSKEVVVKETVYKKDSIVKEYAKVRATITTTKRTLLSDIEMFVTTREPKGSILWSDTFRGEHRWQTEFATYTGDERALSENDLSILNKKRDLIIPTQDEIASQLLRRLESDAATRLRTYYTRYQ